MSIWNDAEDRGIKALAAVKPLAPESVQEFLIKELLHIIEVANESQAVGGSGNLDLLAEHMSYRFRVLQSEIEMPHIKKGLHNS